MDISAFYLDERNSITQPDKLVFVSQYFRRNWMCLLGPTGTSIILYLRGACYHNRKSGETRDTVQISQKEIAEGCGCSIATLKREMERNEALRRFVHVSHEWERNGNTGRVRQLENVYKVAMDDPLIEPDEGRLKQLVEERISREQQKASDAASQQRPKKFIRQGLPDTHSLPPQPEFSNAVNTASSNAVNEDCISQSPAAQFELLRPVAQIELTPAQFELPLKESLLKTTDSKTLNVEEEVNFVAASENAKARGNLFRPKNRLNAMLDELVNALVDELSDLGSENRHRQLLGICERNGLDDLPRQALFATRRRLAQEHEHGVLEKPGAYYQKILIGLLEGHQVFVPPAGSKDEQAEVKRLARASLGVASGGAPFGDALCADPP